MDQINAFLDLHGLVAIFVLLLAKAIGVPIPIPADLIILAIASRSAEGRMVVWQTFLVSWLALVIGGVTQFLVIRTFGRKPLYRYGHRVGLTPIRLDVIAEMMSKRGPFSIGLALVTPGLRSLVVMGGSLGGLDVRVFALGLMLGSAALLSVYFFVGFVGMSLLAKFGLPAALAIAALVILGILAFLCLRYLAKRRLLAEEK